MKTIKISEATGLQLDWLVAKCEGVNLEAFTLYYHPTELDDLDCHGFPEFHYSTVWAQGGQIIDRLFKQGLRLHTAEYVTGVHDKNLIAASLDSPNGFWFGPTPLIAVMRCYVSSCLGNEVEVPHELL